MLLDLLSLGGPAVLTTHPTTAASVAGLLDVDPIPNGLASLPELALDGRQHAKALPAAVDRFADLSGTSTLAPTVGKCNIL